MVPSSCRARTRQTARPCSSAIGVGACERGLGRVEVALALEPADDLQRLARHLREVEPLGDVERAARQHRPRRSGRRMIATWAASTSMRARSPSSARSAASADACARRSSASAQRVAATAARASRRCASARRCGERRVRSRAGPGATRPPRRPGRACRPAPAPRPGTPRRRRRRRRLDGASARARSSVVSAVVERAAIQRAPPGLEQQRRGAAAVAGAFGDLGGQLAPVARAGPGCACLDGVQRACATAGPAPAEAARPARRRARARGGTGRRRRRIDGHDLRVDRGVERGHDRALVESRDRGQELPVEAAPEDGRGEEHGPRARRRARRAGAARCRRR